MTNTENFYHTGREKLDTVTAFRCLKLCIILHCVQTTKQVSEENNTKNCYLIGEEKFRTVTVIGIQMSKIAYHATPCTDYETGF